MSELNAVFNSTKLVSNELEVLVILTFAKLIMDHDGFIETQERLGQESFVDSDTLPTQFENEDEVAARTLLEEAGVKFLGAVEGDDLFQFVELPPGWKRVASKHRFWSLLVDAEGNERAGIFFKASAHDRDAFLRVVGI